MSVFTLKGWDNTAQGIALGTLTIALRIRFELGIGDWLWLYSAGACPPFQAGSADARRTKPGQPHKGVRYVCEYTPSQSPMHRRAFEIHLHRTQPEREPLSW